MQRILVTGATGNTGKAVIRELFFSNTDFQVIAGVRNPAKAQSYFTDFSALKFRQLDFADPGSFPGALKQVDVVFLLRPPQLANVNKYFEPFFQEMQKQHIQHVIFLSVQGVADNRVIPHHKIEKAIRAHSFKYVMLRPSYFMQNLTTTLLDEIRERNRIFLPSGSMQLNWVDVQDIAKASACIINNLKKHENQVYEITGPENLTFSQVADILSTVLGKPVHFKSPALLPFYHYMRRKGMKPGIVLVMILLHYSKLHQKPPRISGDFAKITGKKPNTLKNFLKEHIAVFQQNSAK